MACCKPSALPVLIAVCNASSAVLHTCSIYMSCNAQLTAWVAIKGLIILCSSRAARRAAVG